MARESGAREFGIIVYGASGYTGRLVAQYLGGKASQAPGEVPAFAMAGRNAEKIENVREAIGLDKAIPVITADADDPASLKAMAERAEVVLTTVGPYQRYGDAVLEACIAAGTGYVDLCGEPAWMAQKIEQHQKAAEASGARIIFSCGFDSIPSDLGVRLLQETAIEKHGGPCEHVRMRVKAMKGTFSGGTAESLKETMKAAFKDPDILAKLKNPFSLTPGFEGPRQPSMSKVTREESGVWLAPFVMAPINTKIVHRSNFLGGHRYGTDFKYDEMIETGLDEAGKAIAEKIAGDDTLSSDRAPKPGEGPTAEEREAGMFDLLFTGEAPDGETVSVRVTGDKDPGYGSTSKMIGQAAICLFEDVTGLGGGFYTPASAMGAPLTERLKRHAGVVAERVR